MSGLTWPSAPRIGVVRRFFYDHADEETRKHTDGVLELLSKAGAIVEDVALPDSIDTAIQDQQVIMAVEAAAIPSSHVRRKVGRVPAASPGNAAAGAGHRRGDLFPSAGTPPAVHGRHGKHGRKGGHPVDSPALPHPHWPT